MSNLSPAIKVSDHTIGKLQDDNALTAWLTPVTVNKRIYDGWLAPSGTMLTKVVASVTSAHPYLTIYGGGETSVEMLCDGRVYVDRFQIRVWVPGTSNRLAKVGYAHVARVLSASHEFTTSDSIVRISYEVSLDGPYTDEDNTATQAIADVTAYAVIL